MLILINAGSFFYLDSGRHHANRRRLTSPLAIRQRLPPHGRLLDGTRRLCCRSQYLESPSPHNRFDYALSLLRGILGLALKRSSLRNSLRAALQSSRWMLLLGMVFTLLLAPRSSLLRPLPVLRQRPVRRPAGPGLSILHGRLGFNSSVFLCIAALGQGMWKDLGFHLFTGFLLSALWATLLPACARIVGRTATPPADWFHCILAVPAFF